jgi:hypothetical protein
MYSQTSYAITYTAGTGRFVNNLKGDRQAGKVCEIAMASAKFHDTIVSKVNSAPTQAQPPSRPVSTP